MALKHLFISQFSSSQSQAEPSIALWHYSHHSLYTQDSSNYKQLVICCTYHVSCHSYICTLAFSFPCCLVQTILTEYIMLGSERWRERKCEMMFISHPFQSCKFKIKNSSSRVLIWEGSSGLLLFFTEPFFELDREREHDLVSSSSFWKVTDHLLKFYLLYFN